MPTGLQQNNGSAKGLGQPQQGKDNKKPNGFLDQIGYQEDDQPIFESIAPGIPDRTIDSSLRINNPQNTNKTYNVAQQPTGIPNTYPDSRSFIQHLLGNGPASPQALAAIEPQLQARGINLQKNSAGDIRGRAYLPNPGGYQYGNAVDLVSQWGQPWSYTERHEDAPLPHRAPANEIYSRAQQMLTPQIQNNQDDLSELIMALMSRNQELI